MPAKEKRANSTLADGIEMQIVTCDFFPRDIKDEGEDGGCQLAYIMHVSPCLFVTSNRIYS